MNDCKINILGTAYYVKFVDYKSETCFEKNSISGYCNSYTKNIRIVKMETYPGFEDESEDTRNICMKETLRHEIIHAFLVESGLKDSTSNCMNGWSNFEEMIDWIALQSPKIFQVFKELDIL